MDSELNYNDANNKIPINNSPTDDEIISNDAHRSMCRAHTATQILTRLLLEKKTTSAEAAASGVLNDAGNEVGEIESAEAPAVETEEAPLSDEMESESPTQPLDQLNVA